MKPNQFYYRSKFFLFIEWWGWKFSLRERIVWTTTIIIFCLCLTSGFLSIGAFNGLKDHPQNTLKSHPFLFLFMCGWVNTMELSLVRFTHRYTTRFSFRCINIYPTHPGLHLQKCFCLPWSLQISELDNTRWVTCSNKGEIYLSCKLAQTLVGPFHSWAWNKICSLFNSTKPLNMTNYDCHSLEIKVHQHYTAMYKSDGGGVTSVPMHPNALYGCW